LKDITDLREVVTDELKCQRTLLDRVNEALMAKLTIRLAHIHVTLVVCVIALQVGCMDGRTQVAAASLNPRVDARAAALLYPTAGALIDPFVPFTWRPAAVADGYFLLVGSSPGLYDVAGAGMLPSNVLSWPIDNLLPGRTYYARLVTVVKGEWVAYEDVSFQAAAQPAPDRDSFYATVDAAVASVRLSDPSSNIPVPGSTLANEVTQRHRGFVDCTDFANALVSVFQTDHIYSRVVSLTFTGTGYHTLTEYYDPFQQVWTVADATFGVVYFDDETQLGQSAAQLTPLVLAESWNLIHPKFVTPNKDEYMRAYYLDPIICFENVVKQGDPIVQVVANDPEQFLIPVSGGHNESGEHVFEFSSPEETITVQYLTATGLHTVKVAPLAPTLWSTPMWLTSGWALVDGAPDVKIFTFRRVMF
jgi:hypothetical protein